MNEKPPRKRSKELPFPTPPMWLIPWITRTHIAIYKLTNGKLASDMAGFPGILLRTVGRRSEKPHTVCLPYLPDGEDMVVVASYAGGPKHPAWYHNLKAEPNVIIREKAKVFWAKAETVEGEDYKKLWTEMIEKGPWYEGYQEKTDRKIPLVRLSYARPYTG